MGEFWSKGSPWRGPAFAGGGALLAAFANRLPETIQNAGLCAGLLLCSAGIADVFMHWARERGAFSKVFGYFKKLFSLNYTVIATRQNGSSTWQAKAVYPKYYWLRYFGLSFLMAIAAIVTAYFVVTYFTGPDPEAYEPPTAIAAQRVFARESISDLMGYYAGRTHTEGDVLFAPRQEKWIAIGGTLGDIRPFPGGGYWVYLGHSFFRFRNVSLVFSKKWNARIDEIHQGEMIRAYCQIESADESSVSLNNCELA